MIDNTINKKSDLPIVVAIFCISFIVLLLGQYTPAITGYATRFVTFTHNMFSHGFSYFPLMAHGTWAYPDYPIGNTVLIYSASWLFAEVSVFSIGIPYCIAAALTLVMTYKLGALHDRKWGLYATLFTLLTWKFTESVHFLAVDVYVMFVTVFCFYLVYSAGLKHKQRWLWLLPIMLLIGLFIRGPIGLLMPAGVVFSYYAVEKRWKALTIFSLLAGFLLVAGFSLLLLGAYAQGGVAFMQQVLSAEAIGRLHSHHSFRAYFYFSNGLSNYLITVLFAVIVIIKKRRDIFQSFDKTAGTAKFLLHLTAWFLLIIVALTLVRDKKARYLLSIVPAISLLAAYMFIEPGNIFQRAKQFLLSFCSLLPLLALISIAIFIGYNHFAKIALQGYFGIAAFSFIILYIANILLWHYGKQHPNYQFMVLLLGAFGLLIFNFLLYYPIELHLHLAKGASHMFLPYWP